MTLKDHSSKHRNTHKGYIKIEERSTYSIEEITEMDFTQLKRIGLVNEVKLRNLVIRHEYQQLINNGVYSIEAKEQLAAKFFLSPESVHGIVYKKDKE